MTDADAFLRAILDDPDDESTRLVFADWLDEQGDPRGDFIRVQCALEQLSADDPRREAAETRQWVLTRAHGRQWAGPVASMVREYQFRRGFVEVVHCRAEQFLTHAEELFKTAPVRHAVLHQVGPHMEELARCGWLTRLRALDFKPEFSWRVNDVGATQLNDQDLALLALSPHLRNLRSLDLGWNQLTRAGLASMVARAAGLASLTALDLSHNLIAGIIDLLEAEPWHGLTVLCVGNNPLGAEVARYHQLQRPARLNTFRLEACAIGPEGIESLAACPWLRNLEVLALDGNRVGDSIRQLVESAHLKSLKILTLGSVGLGDAGVATLAEGGWEQLGQLNLQHNQLTSEGAGALARSPLLERLTLLDLRDNALGDEGVAALATAEKLVGIRKLDLSNNQIGPRGVRALLASGNLENIVELSLRENPIDPESAAQLLTRFGHRLNMETFEAR